MENKTTNHGPSRLHLEVMRVLLIHYLREKLSWKGVLLQILPETPTRSSDSTRAKIKMNIAFIFLAIRFEIINPQSLNVQQNTHETSPRTRIMRMRSMLRNGTIPTSLGGEVVDLVPRAKDLAF